MTFPSRLRRSSLAAVLVVSASFAVAACGSSSSSSSSSAAAASSGPAATTTQAGSDASASGAGKKISVTFGYIGTQNIPTGPEGFAYTKGLLQKWLAPDGVTISKAAGFANGPLLTAALVGGSVDVGTIGDTPAIIAKSQGAPTRIINQTQIGLAAWVIAKPGITSLSQLSGKTVARQEASYMDHYIQALDQEKGVKPNLVPMLFAQAIPAFNAGSLGGLVILPNLLPLVKAKYNVVAKSEDTPALEGTSVTEATDKALAEDPDLPKQWNAGRTKAIAYAKAHQAAYYAFQAKAEQTTVPLAKQYFPLSDNPTTPFTSTGLSRLNSTLKFLVATKQAKDFSISSWQSN